MDGLGFQLGYLLVKAAIEEEEKKKKPSRSRKALKALGLLGAGGALAIGGHRTKRETVNEALKEYIARRKRRKSLEAFGTVDFDPKYNRKRARKKGLQ